MTVKEILEKITSAYTNVDDAVEVVLWVQSGFFQQAGLSIDNLIAIAEINREWLKRHEEENCLSDENLKTFQTEQGRFEGELLSNEEEILKYSETVTPACDNEAWQKLVRLAECMQTLSEKSGKWKMILEG